MSELSLPCETEMLEMLADLGNHVCHVFREPGESRTWCGIPEVEVIHCEVYVGPFDDICPGCGHDLCPRCMLTVREALL